jgi:hypothetical protein
MSVDKSLCLIAVLVLTLGANPMSVRMLAAGERPAPSYQKPKARGVTIPYYHGEPPRLGAMFRVERVFTDYQRKGFFRIGLLPFLAAEGVTMDVRDPAVMAESLGALRKWAGAGERKQLVELRRVRIVFPASLGRSVESGKIRLDDDGRWTLEGGVAVALGSGRIEAARASLQVAGPDAGRLTWEADGRQLSLALLQPDATPQPVNPTASSTRP